MSPTYAESERRENEVMTAPARLMKMMGIVKISLLFTFICIIVIGCSYSYRVMAVYRGTELYFVEEDGDRSAGCLWHFSITSEKGEVVWEIHRYEPVSPPCKSVFPLKYGYAPIDFVVEVPPQPLKQGVRYRIRGSDGDTAEGSFSYQVKTVSILSNYAL